MRDLLEHASEIRGLAALYIIERFFRSYHIKYRDSKNRYDSYLFFESRFDLAKNKCPYYIESGSSVLFLLLLG